MIQLCMLVWYPTLLTLSCFNYCQQNDINIKTTTLLTIEHWLATRNVNFLPMVVTKKTTTGSSHIPACFILITQATVSSHS